MARVVVLTPNPAVDVTYRVAQQLIGATVRVLGVQRRAGGKGINVVRVLRTLDVDALAVQPLGGATGDAIRKQLAEDEIAAVNIDAGQETRTTVAVVDDLEHPTLYAEPGGKLSSRVWGQLLDAIANHCEPGGFLVIAGSYPPGTTPNQIGSLVAAGRAAGAFVVVDASGPALIAAANAAAHLVKANEEELLDASGSANLESGVSQLLRLGAGSVLISRGPAGLELVSADGDRKSQIGVPGVSGNPTGAGDAATAGLVSALLGGASQRNALRRAAIIGAAAVLSPTAGEIVPSDLAVLDARLDAFADQLPTLKDSSLHKS